MRFSRFNDGKNNCGVSARDENVALAKLGKDIFTVKLKACLAVIERTLEECMNQHKTISHKWFVVLPQMSSKAPG